MEMRLNSHKCIIENKRSRIIFMILIFSFFFKANNNTIISLHVKLIVIKKLRMDLIF